MTAPLPDTVLIVEDDPHVRLGCVQAMQLANLAVEGVGSAEEALTRLALGHVAVVVTRWFGGIKLGAGGLVRAYGGAAAECLRTATRLERVAKHALEVRAGFAHLGAVHALIDQLGADKTAEDFDAEGVTLQLTLRDDLIERLAQSLRDTTRGQATLRLLD